MDGLPVQDPVLMYDGDPAALGEAVEAYVADLVGGGWGVGDFWRAGQDEQRYAMAVAVQIADAVEIHTGRRPHRVRDGYGRMQWDWEGEGRPGHGAPGVARSWAAGRPYRVGSGGRSVTVARAPHPTDCPTCVRGLVGWEDKKTARRCPVCAGTGRVVG
jgi:hypothetical protein